MLLADGMLTVCCCAQLGWAAVLHDAAPLPAAATRGNRSMPPLGCMALPRSLE